ncbi:MAG: sensor histidine kinase, partial [Campylobacterota bacterium]|nr:sensor histidine kinase [Campylobacterota bacterium]
MMKSLFLALLLKLTLCASSIVGVSLVEDKPSYNFENISEVVGFEPTTLPLKVNATQSYWVRVELNETLLSSDKEYVLNLESSMGRVDYLYAPEYLSDMQNSELLYISREKRSSYYFKILKRDRLVVFNAKVEQLRAYKEHLRLRDTLYGISYGVILSAILYYFSFFIFIKNRMYLYYSLTQLFMLLILILVTIKSEGSGDDMLFSILYSLFILFTALFANAFLELQKLSMTLVRVVAFVTLLLMLETFFDISSRFMVPVAPLMLVYLLTAIYVYGKREDRAVLFYIFGWTLLILSFVLAEVQILFLEDNFMSPTDILHISMPLESLILAFALSYKMKQLKEEQRVKEQMLVHQDKRASIGDMIDNIAHQWRQPLTNIGYIVMNLSAAARNEKLNAMLWEKKSQEINTQLEYMSQTINDFRTFYSEQTQREHFYVNDSLLKMLPIIDSTLISNNILLEIQGNKSLKLIGSQSEFTQVMLNLLSNAKEAFERKSVKDRKITITLLEDGLWVEDSAGGVEESLEKSLFEANASSKAKGGGMGLYMSRLIIEKHFNATLEYQAIEGGSRF